MFCGKVKEFLSQSNIENQFTATGSSTIGERIKTEVKAGNCACEVKNPSGKCCLGDVTRIVKRKLSQESEAQL